MNIEKEKKNAYMEKISHSFKYAQSVTIVFITQSFLNIISVKKDTQTIILQMLTTELIPRKSKKKNICKKSNYM